MRDDEFYVIVATNRSNAPMYVSLQDGLRMTYSLTEADNELQSIHDLTESYDSALEALVSIVAHELIHVYLHLYCQGRPIHNRPVYSLSRNTRPEHDALFSTVSHRLFGMETDCGSRRGWRTGVTYDVIIDDGE